MYTYSLVSDRSFCVFLCFALIVLLIGWCDCLPPLAPLAQHVTNPTLGNALVIISQFFVAGHLCVEQSIVRKYAISPLAVVGWQGVFGLGIMFVMQLVYYFLPGRAVGRRLENAPDAFMQVPPCFSLFLASISKAAATILVWINTSQL